jgi:GTP-binding protein
VIVDKVQIHLKSGNGGEGAVTTMRLSVRRAIGGGGDGGNGGSVIIQVSPHLYDLSKFQKNMRFCAENGGRGGDHNKKGRDGEDVIINVPKGTLIRGAEGDIIVDLTQDGQQFMACRGGRGGKGNYRRNYSTPPQEGQSKQVVLDYRICNDVAILGFANTGKTSLFNKITGKSYKVAEYPFTTTSSVWADCEIGVNKFTILDTPPLKKSTAQKSFENTFLKHLYRSKIILLISDNSIDAEKEFVLLKEEVNRIDENLLKDKKNFYLLSKVDKIDKTIDLDNVIPISVEKNKGIEKLKQNIIDYLEKKEE